MIMTPTKLTFFLQAEDGIRDYKVTGVQTCALPIYRALHGVLLGDVVRFLHRAVGGVRLRLALRLVNGPVADLLRSEERRVGREERRRGTGKNDLKERIAER